MGQESFLRDGDAIYAYSVERMGDSIINLTRISYYRTEIKQLRSIISILSLGFQIPVSGHGFFVQGKRDSVFFLDLLAQ